MKSAKIKRRRKSAQSWREYTKLLISRRANQKSPKLPCYLCNRIGREEIYEEKQKLVNHVM